jgi:hypothetical protein
VAWMTIRMQYTVLGLWVDGLVPVLPLASLIARRELSDSRLSLPPKGNGLCSCHVQVLGVQALYSSASPVERTYCS